MFTGYFAKFTKKSKRCVTKMYEGVNETWSPCEVLFSQNKNENYAVLILNTNFKLPSNVMVPLWSEAKLRVTVDGGTERWLSWLKSNNLDFSSVSPPDLITGDMDSLSKELLDFFVTNKISKVIKTPDQNETDFTKALIETAKVNVSENLQLDTVYVIADTCGRLDQIIANINTLCKAMKILSGVKVFQVATNSVTWLLQQGTHTIHIPLELRDKNEWCALIPVISPTYSSTSGLKWNLDNSKLEFGSMVSTSNTYDGISSKVTVQTEKTLLWSMGIEALSNL